MTINNKGPSDVGIKGLIAPGIDYEVRKNPLHIALANNLKSSLRSLYFKTLEAMVLQNNIEV